MKKIRLITDTKLGMVEKLVNESFEKQHNLIDVKVSMAQQADGAIRYLAVVIYNEKG